jgi:hypothetical protein
MVAGKVLEVKLGDGHKLLIWWTLEAYGGAGIVDCGARLRGPPGNPSGRAAMGGCPPSGPPS